MWIDSHCHLNHATFADALTPEILIQDAREHHVSGLLSICCRVHDEFPALLALVQAHDNVWCSLGTHPHDAGHPNERIMTQAALIQAANSASKVIAIGESGLDFHYDYAPRDDQEISFRKHIRVSLETGLPLIIHAREADNDIIRILKEEAAGSPLKGVMHCFSSGAGLAKYALEIGFYISFSGIITFKNAHDLRTIAHTVPLNRLLVETDAPYLAPAPHRGKQNRPAYVVHTGEYLADFLGYAPEDFAAQTTRNFFALFDKANAS